MQIGSLFPWKRVLAAAGVALASAASPVRADVATFRGAPAPATTRTDAFQAGWGFYASTAGTKQVNRFGLWVPNGATTVDHEVALYNHPGYVLIAKATVPAGSTADADGYAWVTVPTLTLTDTRQSADYYIVLANLGTDTWGPLTGSSYAPTLNASFGTPTGNAWFHAAGAFTATETFTGSLGIGGYFGPNLGFVFVPPTYVPSYWKGATDGIWNSNVNNWTTDAAGATPATALPDSSRQVCFTAGGAANLGTTLGANFSIGGLNFTTASPVTIGGGNTLTLGAGGLTVTAGSGAHAINCAVGVGAEQIWANASANALTVNGPLSGAGAVTFCGGTFILGGVNTYSAATTMNAAMLTIKGQISGTTAQTLASLALSGGANSISLDPNGGAGTTLTITSSTANRSNGAGVKFVIPTGGTVAWSPTLSNGIVGPWATGNIGGGAAQYATASGGTIAGYVGTARTVATLPTSGGTENAELTAGGNMTQAAGVVNTVRYSGGTDSFNLWNHVLTLNGLLAAGSAGTTLRFITGAPTSGYLTTPSGRGDLVISGPQDIAFTDGTYNSIVRGVYTRLVYNGTGALHMGNGGGAHDYGGGTVVNSGTMVFGTVPGGGAGNIRGSLAINSGATVHAGGSWNLGHLSGSCVSPISIDHGTLKFSANAGFGGTAARVITLKGGAISGGGGGNTFDWYKGITTTPVLATVASSDRSTVSANLALRLAASGSVTFNVAQGSTSDGIDLLVSGNIVNGAEGGGIVKIGAGTMKLSGANTYTGMTTVSGGLLRLGADNTLQLVNDVTLNGGALDAGTAVNHLGYLTLSSGGTSALVLGSGGRLSFKESRAKTWSGHINIEGALANTSLQFGSDRNGLTPEQLLMLSYNGNPVDIDVAGYITRALQGTVFIVQ